jgi:fructokinase
MRQVFGGVEAGGTKFQMILGTGPEDILDELRIPTTTPEETLGRVIAFFRRPRSDVQLAAVGFASFGPIDLNLGSPTYGHITTTPKPGWRDTDVVGALRSALDVPVGWDTDVTGAALGEHRWGAGQGVQNLVYLTVGTGIGGGALVNGRPVHGLPHPEMGHLLVPPLDGDTFQGVCPYHGRCLEGMASGPALERRLGRRGEDTSWNDPVWEMEAYYLAAGLHDIGYVLSPERIILGGGVGGTPRLLERVRKHVMRLNHEYLAATALNQDIDRYIVPPSLGPLSGSLGALILAGLAAGETVS